MDYNRSMSDTAPTRRPLQFTLRSLFVFTTVVAVLCSIGVSTHWRFPFKVAAGISILWFAFGPLSLKREEPNPRFLIVFAALSVRCLGYVLVSLGLADFVEWFLRRFW